MAALQSLCHCQVGPPCTYTTAGGKASPARSRGLYSTPLTVHSSEGHSTISGSTKSSGENCGGSDCVSWVKRPSANVRDHRSSGRRGPPKLITSRVPSPVKRG